MAKSGFFSQTGSDAGTVASVQNKVDEAEAAKVAAEAARDTAEGHRDTAETHKNDASVAQTAAESARDNANIHKTAAEGFKDDSEGFKDDSAASATAAAASEGDAEDAKADAEKLAVNVEDAQYTLSDGSTTGYSALHYAAKAEDAKEDAEKLAINAEDAQYTLSDGSTTGYSALHYKEKADDARALAVQAKDDAVIARTNAETAQANSETAQANSETAETNAETAQANSETARDTAEDHRDDAQKIASNAEDTQYTLADGSTTGYSALHYKEKAADSATASAASATTATTQAGISTTQAGTSTTKATEASNSASSAASAQTAAEAARDSALAALDSFDDRYLGVKSAAPTVDNDGNALQTGALFFSSTDDAMKVYDGTQWLNAYASLSGALIANQNLSDLTNAGTARTNLGISTVGNTGAFSDLTGTPTTISGYGITDALQLGTTSTTALAGNSGLTALGISDGTNGQALKTDGSGNFSFGDVATSTAWADITSKPTTISGFGITDAFDGAYGSLTGTPTIPTNNNQLTNGAGYITSADGGNATTLDGIDSGSFLRSDASDSASGTLTLNGEVISSRNTNNYFRIESSNSGEAMIRYNNTTSNYWYVGIRSSTSNGLGTSDYHIYSSATGQSVLGVTAAGTAISKNQGTLWGSSNAPAADYPKVATGNYGTIKVDDNRGVSWAGYAIRDDWVFMSNDADTCGIYNDTDNEWALLSRRNAETEIMHNGTMKLETRSDGVTIAGWSYYSSTNGPRTTGAWIRNQTAYGYIDIGPANSGHAHIYTDRSNFYFNKTINSTGNVTAYASDERLKENIETIDNALDMVGQLRGVTFDWKDDCEEKGFTPEMKHETGVIAQEVQKVIPDAVTRAPFDNSGIEGSDSGENYLTVDKEKIIPVLIEAIKELKAEIETLKKG